MQRQFELVGGPMDGMCHELRGNIMPAEAGLHDSDEVHPTELHWYEFRDGRGYYLRTESIGNHWGGKWEKP